MDDPILMQAVRELLTKKQALANSGENILPEHEEEFLRVKTGGKFGLKDAQGYLATIDPSISLRNLGRSALQGLTFNFGDELAGLFGGDEAKADFRMRDEAFKEKHKYADAAAGIAGSLPYMLLPGVGEAKSLAQAAKVGAGIGAATGALAGAGSGEGLEDRVVRAGVGGVAGTAIGAAAPAVASGLGGAFSATGRASRRVADAVSRSEGGIGGLLGRVSSAERAGRGDMVMLGDLSQPLQTATDFAANNSEPVYDKLSSTLYDRGRGMAGRMVNDVKTLLGREPNAEARASELAQNTSAFGKSAEGYQGLRDANPQIPGSELAIARKAGTPGLEVQALTKEAVPLHQILNKPVVLNHLAKAIETGDIARLPERGALSFRAVQEIKESLDDAADAAFRGGNGNRGVALAGTRDELVDWMTKHVPGFDNVAAQYAKLKGLENSVQRGIDAWSEPETRQFVKSFTTLAPEMQDQVREGLASQLVTKLRGAMKNRDSAREIIDASAATEDKLLAIFGTKQRFDSFMERAGWERDMNRLKSATGGSATHRRGAAEGADPLELAHSLAGGPLGLMHAAGKAATQASTGRIGRRTAASMGDALMTQGAPNIRAFLASLQANPSGFPAPGRLSTAGVPLAATSLWDHF